MPSATSAPLWALTGAVAAGGALGAAARYGLTLAWPPPVAGMSWTVLAINVTGSLLIGVLVEVLAHRIPRNPWVRPFLGTGFLGGYTTFSAYAMDVVTALERGAPETALAHLSLTLAGALVAAWAASALTHRILQGGDP
ncbi:putative fluoride ion transporter CrcB [Nocardiopsis kunsanensis]|uniref:Fluoride-specific ion channel FluC n=1 Tax=Nocardiopsis kunsanensis TaxID=141693 RepID=A0A918XB03_9ACTN|nr:CrcB family protein [Nocardiopsis kunsanensis]GHD21712.1 putative fluoride ion transporter CrcB [Nocardiopsis kunsanensis]